MDFWDIARHARIGAAGNQTSENIAARLSAFRQVVGNGAEVATVAEFGAKVFASEVMLSNLGPLSFDRQFGPVTLKAMFGPAVLTGFEGGLNWSTQHFILNGKDGVCDESKISSRFQCVGENGVMGSLAAGGVAESDWASVW
jgi:hypothetical protein